jgi:hypothetical protein
MTVFHWIYLDWFPVMGVAISQTSGSVNAILSSFFFYLPKKRGRREFPPTSKPLHA